MGAATGRNTVRTISVASLPASDCSFVIACLLVLLHAGARLLDLFLRASASLIHGLAAGLRRLLAAGFLVLENLLAGFAKALLVIRGARFGGGDVGARFFHRALGAIAALGQHGGQRTMHQKGIKDVEQSTEE